MRSYSIRWPLVLFVLVQSLNAFGQYDTDVLGAGEWKEESKIEAKADPRCDRDFVRKLSAQEECFGHNPSMCLYLGIGASGVAGTGLGAAIGSALNKLGSDKAFLDKYKNVFETTYDNNSSYRQFKRLLEEAKQNQSAEKNTAQKNGSSASSIDPAISETQKLKTALHGVVDKLNKNMWGSQVDAFKEFIDSGEWNPRNIEEKFGLRTSIRNNKALKEAFGDQFNEKILKEYDQLTKKYLRDPIAAASQQLDPSYEKDFTELRARIDAARLSGHNSEYEKANGEFNKRAQLHRELTQRKINSIEFGFDRMISEKYPDQVLYGVLKQTADPKFDYDGANYVYEFEEVQFKQRLKIDRNQARRVNVGSATGALAGVAALPALDMAVQKKLSFCAKDLNLSKGEVDILNPHVKGKSLLGKCADFEMGHEQEALNDAIEKFGFVPKGLCEMAIKSSQRYDSVARTSKSLKDVTCDSLTGENFQVTTNESGQQIFSCTDKDNTYKAPMGQDGAPDFSLMTSFYKKTEHPNLALRLKEKIAPPPQQIQSGDIHAADQLRDENLSFCSKSKESSALCTCGNAAIVAQATLSATKILPSCSKYRAGGSLFKPPASAPANSTR